MPLNDSLQAKVDVIINGEKALGTMREMTNAAKTLAQAYKLADDPALKKQIADQYQNINKEITKQNTLLKGTGGIWNSLGKEMKQFGMLAAGYLGFQFITSSFRNIIQGNAKLSDSFADVRKTTGLSMAGVNELYIELGKFNTRSSRAELMALAVEAGKLGKSSVEDVKKFVKEADMIKVALGDALGEGAVTDIGKLSDIFKVSMLNIASAVNEIGNASTATEGFQVQFLSAISGVATTAHLAADELLGYGATLESLGQTQVVRSTALKTFFIEFVRDTEKFGEVAGFARGELSKLMAEKGTNEGFLEFLTKIKEGSKSSAEMLGKLKELGIDGARGATVFLTLAENIGKVKEQQLIANKAIQSSSSVMNEFNIRNETFGAALDKLGKRIYQIVSSPALTNFLKSLTLGFYNLITPTEDYLKVSEDMIRTNQKTANSANKLLAEYESLTKDGVTPTKQEKERLKQITLQLRDALGESVVSINKETGALEINKAAVKEVIKQKLLLANQEASSLALRADNLKEDTESTRGLTKELESELVSRKQILDSLGVTTTAAKNYYTKILEGGATGIALEKQLGSARKEAIDQYIETENQIQRNTGKISAQEKEYQKIIDKLKELGFTQKDIEKMFAAPSPTVNADGTTTNTTTNVTNVATGDTNPALKKQQQFQEDTLKLIERYNELKAAAVQDEAEKELAILQAKFDKEKEDILSQHVEVTATAGTPEHDDQLQRNEAVNNAKLALEEKFQKEKADIVKKYSDKLDAEQLKQDLDNLEEWHSEKELAIKKDFANQHTSQEEFEMQSGELQLQYLALKIFNLKQYERDSKTVSKERIQAEQELADARIAINKKTNEKILALLKGNVKDATAANAEMLQQLSDKIQELLASGASEEEIQKAIDAYNTFLEQLSTAAPKGNALKQWLDKNLQYIQRFSSALSNIFSNLERIANNKSDAQLKHELRNLDKQDKHNRDLADRKIITEEEYTKRHDVIEDRKAKKERKARYEAAKNARDFALFSAIINTAMAATSGFATTPFWPVGVIMGALALVEGGVEIAAIESEPLPELGKGEMISQVLKGPKHSSSPSRGLPVVDPNTGRTVMRLEGGEVVGSAAFVDKNPELANDIVTAGQLYDGDLTRVDPMYQNFSSALPYYSASQPTVNYSRVKETMEMGYGGYIGTQGRIIQNIVDDTDSSSSTQREATPYPTKDNTSSTANLIASNMEKYYKSIEKHDMLLQDLSAQIKKGFGLDWKRYKQDKSRFEAMEDGRRQ
ncbi:MAG: phage tail tape measure protein [Sediminibacterium sp.]